jgi:hypothetical protein
MSIALLSSVIEGAALQAVPPSEDNIAMPHEEEEEWVAVNGGGVERIVNAAARGMSSASRTIAKKRRTRKNTVCNNMPCGLKGTPHDGLCTHMGWPWLANEAAGAKVSLPPLGALRRGRREI